MGNLRFFGVMFALMLIVNGTFGQNTDQTLGRSIRSFGVLPTNPADLNARNLQKAIDWASPLGAALFVDPTDESYPVSGGIILKKNVSLIGANAAAPRGTSHPTKHQPVGSVFKITDQKNVFITVE